MDVVAKEVSVSFIGDGRFRATFEGDVDPISELPRNEFLIEPSEDGGYQFEFTKDQRADAEDLFRSAGYTIDRDFVSYSAIGDVSDESEAELDGDDVDVDEELFDAIESGENVLLTGAPGTGKTHTLTRIVSFLHEHLLIPMKNMRVAAMSAIAARNINSASSNLYGARTLHSALRIQKGDEHREFKTVLRRRAAEEKERKAKARKRGQDYEPIVIDHLILDEVSLLSASLFDLIRRLYPTTQFIFVGDPVQMRPVRGEEDPEGAGRYFFEHKTLFEETFGNNTFELTENHRLRNAPPGVAKKYLEMLMEIRETGYVRRHLDMLRDMSEEKRLLEMPDDKTERVQIFAWNKDADAVNQEFIDRIEAKGKLKYTLPVEFVIRRYDKKSFDIPHPEGEDAPKFDIDDLPLVFRERLKDRLRRSKPISVIKGVPVLLTTNLNVGEGLVNGALGHVTTVSKNCTVVEVSFGEKTIKLEPIEAWHDSYEDSKEEVEWHVTCKMIPIRLGVAITAHSSIGLTVQTRVDLSHMGHKAPGVAYVALSRTPDPTKCIIENVDEIVDEELVDPAVRDFYELVAEKTAKRREEAKAKAKAARRNVPVNDAAWTMRGIPEYEPIESGGGYFTMKDILAVERERKRARCA